MTLEATVSTTIAVPYRHVNSVRVQSTAVPYIIPLIKIGWCSMTNECLPGSQSACDCLGTCNTSNWLFHNCPALAIATPMISGFATNVVTPLRQPVAVV